MVESRFWVLRADVSIPRSGFWVFKLPLVLTVTAGWISFNPSVGILGVQASTRVAPASWLFWFQSLGRDSGCSSRPGVHRLHGVSQVSIPRSGFWVFKHHRPPPSATHWPCFNPSVGILGVQAISQAVRLHGYLSFNPSVGILGVQAAVTEMAWPCEWKFQSLGRDSGCSSCMSATSIASDTGVSIPRSGFWVFKRHFSPGDASPPTCFNPSVGILGVQAPRCGGRCHGCRWFQSLGRDSGCSSQERRRHE